MTKMGYIASKKYCRKKYRKEVRKHMKGIGPVFFANTGVLVIICLILEGETALLTVGSRYFIIYIDLCNQQMECRTKMPRMEKIGCSGGNVRIWYVQNPLSGSDRI